MRQRLGIATALIGEPEVLILDEPANGLDPAGIRWMRGLLREYADRGGTVLLSSHLLHEIEVVADDLVVIGNGRIVAQGAKSDLLRSAGSMLRTPDRDVVARALLDAGVTSTPVGTDGLLAQAEPRRSARSPSPPAYPSSSCGPRTAPAWRRCSSSSPPRPSATPPATTTRRSSRMTTIATTPAPVAGPHHHGHGHRPPDHPAGPHRHHRAAQDVRHPVGVLADGEHRHPGAPRHGGGDRVLLRRRADLQHVRDRRGLPDDGRPADHRDPVGDQ